MDEGLEPRDGVLAVVLVCPLDSEVGGVGGDGLCSVQFGGGEQLQGVDLALLRFGVPALRASAVVSQPQQVPAVLVGAIHRQPILFDLKLGCCARPFLRK